MIIYNMDMAWDIDGWVPNGNIILWGLTCGTRFLGLGSPLLYPEAAAPKSNNATFTPSLYLTTQ